MNQLDLATKAAWLAYIGGYTQSEVAQKLNISSVKAHRLIAQAHANNIVKIFVEGEIIECVELEEKISKQFNLDSCIVAPTIEGVDSFKSVGAAGASFLYNLLKNNKNKMVGVGKGRSLSAVVENLPHFQTEKIKFVSVSGGLTRRFSTNPYDVIHRLAERTNSEAFFLPVPYMAKDESEKQMLLEQNSVRQMLDFAKQAEIYLVGIGSIESNAHVHESGLIEESIWDKMIKNQAVGDFMGRFLDTNGNELQDSDNNLSLGLSSEDIRGKKVIAIVGGSQKGKVTQAVLQRNIITDLIISEESAKELIKLMKSYE